MDVPFLMSIFRLYPELKITFEHNSFRKSLFQCACFCWDSGNSLGKTDRKFEFGGLIGYQTFYLDSVYLYSKVFRLHAIVHDAAGAMRTNSGKGPGYCYIIRWGLSSCFLGHVTGLHFFLYLKFFLPSIFKSVDFWSSVSLIVLDIELTEKKVIKVLGFFIGGSLEGFSLCPPKTFKHNRQTTWNTSHLHRIAWSCGRLDYEELFAVFYDKKVMNAEVFAKKLEKCRLLIRLIGQNVEILDDYGCPKNQGLVKTDSSCISSSYPSRHKTRLHFAERKAKVYGEWAMQQL